MFILAETVSNSNHLGSHTFTKETTNTSGLKYFNGDINEPEAKKHPNIDSENSNKGQDSKIEQHSNQYRQWMQPHILRRIFDLLKLEDLRAAAQFVLLYTYPKQTVIG